MGLTSNLSEQPSITMTTPIFILSLPRSGSTLLQRLLLSSGECASTGETSLLLRFVGNSQTVQRYANYRESNLELSFRDLCDHHPDFPEVYSQTIRSSMLKLYSHLAGDKRYYIDKTPRYTLIANEIRQFFPDAKIVVLWRHPLAIASSISKTFFKGRWVFDDFMVDFDTGLDRLYAFSQTHANSICCVHYETLIKNPEQELKKLSEYLDCATLCQDTSLKLPEIKGTLGDPTRHSKGTSINSTGSENWKLDYTNWYRKQWARRIYTPQRREWLNTLGYGLPDCIAPSTTPKNLIEGYQEWRYHRKKMRKGLRLMQQIFKQHHISPYGVSPPKQGNGEASELDSQSI